MTYVLTTLHESSELDSSKLGLNTAVCMHLPVFIFKIKLTTVTEIFIKVVISSLAKIPLTSTSVLHVKKLFAICLQSAYKYLLEFLLQVFIL